MNPERRELLREEMREDEIDRRMERARLDPDLQWEQDVEDETERGRADG